MFYSQFILAKKGPLGTIWIAAHLERKLRKNQVADTDIGVSVDSILFPDVPIALRLSSHLLLGVVRIYSKKVNYLFDDCSEALLKIKQAFRSTAVDLPPEESTAPYHSITLPETFDLDDFELPENEMLQGNYVDHHVSTKDQITLQDTMEGIYSTSQFGLDERFGDGDTSQIGLVLDEDLFLSRVMGPGCDGLSLSRDGQASVQPATPLKIDEINEGTTETSDTILDDDNMKQIEGLAAGTDIVEFADAPSTPVLVGEPILINDMEALGFDDNLLSINLNSAALTVEENIENETSDLDFHQENRYAVCSTCNDLIVDDVPNNPVEDSCYTFSEQQFKHVKPQEDSSHPVEKFGLQSNSEPDTPITDFIHAEDERSQGTKLDETVVTSVIGCESSPMPSSDTEITCQGIDASGILEGVLEEVKEPQASACEEPKDFRILERTSGELASSTLHLLQDCRSHVQEPNVLSQTDEVSFMVPEVQGRGCEVADVMIQTSGANLTFETIPCKYIWADGSKLADQLVNDISGNAQFENLYKTANPDLPGPEKFILVPDITDKTNEEDERECTSILGKKRSLEESSLTLEIHNSEKPFNLLQSKRTADSIPNDDDLLSSILVGRSSVLKIKSTPSPEVAPVKRLRSEPLMSTIKRKVLMDDSMILHGDIIRQQLMSTEDIRRVRKKAPCTRPEIWMTQKQFLDDEIFNEPIFTGMSLKLVFLHRGINDLTGINFYNRIENDFPVNSINENTGISIVRSDEKESLVNTPLEGGNQQTEDHFIEILDLTEINNSDRSENKISINATKDTPLRNTREFDDNENIQMSIVRNDERESFVDTPIHGENQQTEDQIFDSFQEKALQNETLHLIEVGSTDLATTKPADYDVTPGTEPQSTIPFKGDFSDMTSGFEFQSTLSQQTNSVASCLSPGTMTNEQSINNISSIVETDSNKIGVVGNEYTLRDEFSLHETEVGPSLENGIHAHFDCCESSGNIDSYLANSCHSNGEVNDQNSLTGGSLRHDDKIELDIIKEKIFGDAELNFDCNNVKFGPAVVEEPKLDASYSSELEENMRKCSLYDEETLCIEEAGPQYKMDVENNGLDLQTVEDFGESENIKADHDTGFLNVDDDDDAIEDDNYIPSAEEAEFFENSGWSSRTRAVAKYLQTLFDREAKDGKKVLPMDNLVVGKSRKEASRMFFETLVLKTRDYIHVDQSKAFGEICIKPGIRLIKSSF